MTQHNLDILAITEVSAAAAKQYSQAGFRFELAGKKGGGCVGFVVRTDAVRKIVRSEILSSRVMTTTIQVEKTAVTFVAGYAPIESSTKEEKEEFWLQVDTALREARGNAVLMGDFNANIRRADSDNGESLKTTCTGHDLTILNKTTNAHWTWRGPITKWRPITLDFIAVRHEDDVSRTRCVTVGLNTDHRMLITRFLPKYRKHEAYAPPQDPPDQADLTDPVEAAYHKLLSRYQEKTQTQAKTATQWKTWLTPEARAAVQAKHDARRALGLRETKAKRTAYKAAKKKATRLVKEAWNAYWEQWAKDLEEAFDKGDSATGFRTLQRHYRPRAACRIADTADANACKKYVEQLLKDPHVFPPKQVGTAAPLQTAPYKGGEPSKDEIDEALRLVHNTAPGPDLVKIGIVRNDAELRQLLVDLVVAVWRHGKLPRGFKRATLVALPKKSGATAWTDHRFISLLSTAGKVVTRILLHRLKAVEDHPAQHGFTRGTCTVNAIAQLKHLSDQARRRGIRLVYTFVDAEKAYDKIPRSVIFETAQQAGMDQLDLHLLQDWYDDEVRVRLGGAKSDPFKTRVGLRQGCLLSPVLFKLILNRVLLHIGPKLSGVALDNTKILLAAFADDIALVSLGTQEAEKDLQCLAESMAAVGLKINKKKTVYMVTEAVLRKEEPASVSEAAAAATRPFSDLPEAIRVYGDCLGFICSSKEIVCPFPECAGKRYKGDVCIRTHFQDMHKITVNVLKQEPTCVVQTPTTPEENAQCPVCLKVYAQRRGFLKHWRAQHPTVAATYPVQYLSGANKPLVGVAAGSEVRAEANRDPIGVPTPITKVHLFGTELERVSEFRYLGRILTEDDDDDKAARARLAIARSTFAALRSRFFRSKHATPSTKVRVAQAVLRAQLVYGSETMVISAHTQRAIRSFQQQVLRWCTRMHPIVTGKGPNRKFTYPRTEDVLKRANAEDIILYMEKAKLRWWGHILRSAAPPGKATRDVLQSTLKLRTLPSLNEKLELRNSIVQLLKRANLTEQDAHDKNKWHKAIRELKVDGIALAA